MNYRKYLTEDILPFWLKSGIDRKSGGIYTMLDKCGKIKDTNKAIWFTGRSLWTFATAYNTVEKRPEYMEACKQLYSFYKKCILQNGRLPYLTDDNGNALEVRQSFHSELFAAIGCAQYYKACQREEVKDDALKFFDIVYDMYISDKAGFTADADNPRHIFGIEMMVIFISQFMRNSGICDNRFDELAEIALKNIVNFGFINEELNITSEYTNANTNTCQNPREDFSCMGHIYAASWIIMSEGVLKGDKNILMLGKKILDTALSFEDAKIPKLVKLGNTSGDNEYLWWPQCEAIIAYYTAHSIFGDEKYLTYAKSIEDASFKCFADTENGEWYTSVAKDGSPLNTDKGGMMKGPFHLPRMLMAMVSLSEGGSLENYLA